MHTFSPDVLKGKSALVSGGASGIGMQIVRVFLNHGCNVMILSRKQQNLDKALQGFNSFKQRIQGKVCDVRKFQDCKQAVSQAVQLWGRVDILVNGAAGNFLAPFHKLTEKGFRTVLQIDTIGTFNLTKAWFHLGFKGQSLILNISASLHYNGTALQTHAGVAKAGVDALTKHLAVELGPLGVRVNGICPGPIDDTEGMRKLNPQKGKQSSQLAKMIPLERAGRKQDIAHAALFLASQAASFITGHTLVVDGGQVLTSPNFTWPFESVRKQLMQGQTKL